MPPPSRSLTRGFGLLTAARPSCSSTHPLSSRPPAAVLPSARTLSTTAPTSYKQKNTYTLQGLPIPSPTARHPEIPPYPYGERRVYKQSNTGLYGSQSLRFGNTISGEKGPRKHDHKSRRQWRPNVQHKRLYSHALGCMVRTRVTTRVMRTIDKLGGLDNYLLGEKAQRIKDLGPWGWRLRWRVMQTPTVKEMFAKQRVALGLPPAGAGETVLPGGESAEDTMRQVQQMLDGDHEFDLGVSEHEEPAEKLGDGFMREEKRPKGAELRA